MTNAGASGIAHHSGRWESTIWAVDMDPAMMNTRTRDRPIASSYEITCAVERTEPSSGYVDPEDQPPRTIPYTPTDAHARTYSVATGRSVSCSGVVTPNTVTDGPNGITAKVSSAQNTEIIGASRYTTLSAALDRKSTRLNSSHANISYAVFCLKKKRYSPSPSRPSPARSSGTSATRAGRCASRGGCTRCTCR